MTPETPSSTAVSGRREAAGEAIEREIAEVGRQLGRSIGAVLEAVPGSPHRPQTLASTLGVDKVLASRLLKAVPHRDPLAVVHLAPGAEPMRRVLRAARRHGVPHDIVEPAMAAVDAFDRLIRTTAGDRSALDAMLSAWLPEARAQFEIRRKQSAYRAMSELKGGRADVNFGTALLHPSDDGTHLDVVWVMGLIGVRRLRPHAPVKFATRRFADADSPRRPSTLEGEPVEAARNGLRLERHFDTTPAALDVQRVGDVAHYTLAGSEFGPRAVSDVLITEVNRAEIPRYVPRRLGRKGYVFAEIALPSRILVFDVFVHDDVYPRSEPTLFIYDTVLDGAADVNDPARDASRLDLLETITPLGRGTARIRVAEIPRYASMIKHVFAEMEWRESAFRGYRCRIDYPIYGSQVTMAFDPPPPPGDE